MGKKKQKKFYIEKELEPLIDGDPRPNSEVANTALWREVGGRRKSSLELRIDQKDRRIETIKQEIEELQEELADVKGEREVLVEKLEELEETESSYEDDLLMVLQEFANSRAVLPRWRSDCMEIADEHGKSLGTIEDDLRDLAEREGLDIDEERWTDDYGDGLQ